MQVARAILVLTFIGDGVAEVIGVWSLREEVVGVRGSVFALTWEMGWPVILVLRWQACWQRRKAGLILTI